MVKAKRANVRVGARKAARFATEVFEAVGGDSKEFAAIAELVRLMAERSRAQQS